MSKKIHPSDLEKQKQVFEVTLPKFNLENLYICVGNEYDHMGKHNRYTIYNVDKVSRNVTENIGYYEFPKDKNVSELMDSEGDFKVMEMGEENMTIYDEFKLKFSKSQRQKTTKPPLEKPKKSELEADTPPPSPPNVPEPDFVPIDIGNIDEEEILKEYFNDDKELDLQQIVPIYMENFVKPGNWVNSIGIDMTGIHVNTYIIIVSNGKKYKGKSDSDSGDGKYINNEMAVYPRNGLDYDPARKYVFVLYENRNHYKLLEHEDKVLFNENELPQKVIDRFCKPHHDVDPKLVGVENSLELTPIITADQGDCFFDSIFRAIKTVPDIHAAKNEYLPQVHEFRKEIAEGVKGNKTVEENIKQLYNLFSQKDYTRNHINNQLLAIN